MHRHYTTPHLPIPCPFPPAAPVLPRGMVTPRPTALVVWLRCRACHRGYFTDRHPGPQPCPACAGGHLQFVTIWDLGTEAAPAGMIRRGEVKYDNVG